MKKFRIGLSVAYKVRDDRGRYATIHRSMTTTVMGDRIDGDFDREIDAYVLSQAPSGLVARGIEVTFIREDE